MTPDQIFELAYSFDRKAEGGYVVDGGGPTQGGITQHEYSDWLKRHDMPDNLVRSITDQEIHQINYEDYWSRFHLDQVANIAPLTAIALFDFGENIWPVRPIEMLQRRCHAVADSIIGGGTLNAIGIAVSLAGGDLPFALQFNQDRRAWYESNSPAADIHGLINRVNALDAYITKISETA